MTTLLALTQALVVLAVFWLPGYAVATASGLPGLLRRVVIAPALTLGVFFAASWIAAVAHVRWTLPLALACTGTVAVGGLGLRRRFGASEARRPRSSKVGSAGNRVFAGVLTGSVILQLWPVWRALLQREQVPNLPDAVFHLNALQYVRMEGIADPRVFGSLIDPSGGTPFYPTAWHAIAGVVPVLLDNASLMAAASFTVIVLAWTLGVAALARELATERASLVAVLAATLAATGFSSPLEPAVSLGIIPDAVGLALVPGVATLLVLFARSRFTAHPAPLLTALGFLGLAGCHPSAFAGAVILGAPWFATATQHWWLRCGRQARIGGAVLGVVLLAAAAYAATTSTVLQSVRANSHEGVYGLGDAMIGLVFGFTWEAGSVGVLVPICASLAWVQRLRRRGDRQPLVSGVLVGALYVLAATDTAWARPVTGLFYIEPRRIAPLVAIWAVVLGAEGLATASSWIVSRTQLPARVPAGAVVAFIAGVVAAAAAWQPFLTLRDSSRDVYSQTLGVPVTVNEMIPFFTTAELAMVHRLPSELPTGSVLFGSGKSGVSYVYGIEGITALPFARGLPEDLTYAGTNIDRIQVDPRVCEAFRSHGVRYLYTDDDLWKAAGWPILADPFRNVPPTALRLVDQGGHARLYELTACSGRQGQL